MPHIVSETHSYVLNEIYNLVFYLFKYWRPLLLAGTIEVAVVGNCLLKFAVYTHQIIFSLTRTEDMT